MVVRRTSVVSPEIVEDSSSTFETSSSVQLLLQSSNPNLLVVEVNHQSLVTENSSPPNYSSGSVPSSSHHCSLHDSSDLRQVVVDVTRSSADPNPVVVGVNPQSVVTEHSSSHFQLPSHLQ